MQRYLVLLPAPEQEWAALPPEAHEQGQRAHERFSRELRDGGHQVITAGPLTPSAQAVSMRPDGSGAAIVTEGPFTDAAEQIVGFYLIDTPDPAALTAICAQLASTGDHIELRALERDDPAEP